MLSFIFITNFEICPVFLLQAWLEAHPGWEEVVEDEEHHSEEEQRQEDDVKKAIKDESKLGDEVTIEVIQKAKVEDDEYKTDDGEKNYYSIAHTIHEKVHGQASILINGKLKGKRFKGVEWCRFV